MVPTNIFDNLTMSIISLSSFKSVWELVWGVDIPDADQIIIWAREEETWPNWVPSKAKTFSFVSKKLKIWFNLIIWWLWWVLEVVEYMYLAANSLCSDDIHALRHVSCFIDFSLMVNLSFNCDLFMFRNSLSTLSGEVGLSPHRQAWWLRLILGVFWGL